MPKLGTEVISLQNYHSLSSKEDVDNFALAEPYIVLRLLLLALWQKN
jgi:hypothetical protein